MHIHTRTHTLSHPCARAHTHTHAHIHIYTHIHTYTHAHTHMHCLFIPLSRSLCLPLCLPLSLCPSATLWFPLSLFRSLSLSLSLSLARSLSLSISLSLPLSIYGPLSTNPTKRRRRSRLTIWQWRLYSNSSKTSCEYQIDKKAIKIWTYGAFRSGHYFAGTSRLLKITGLSCRISSILSGSLQKRPIILRSLLIVAVTRDHNRVINLIHVAFRLIWDSCRLSTDIKIIGLFCKRAL